MAQPFETLLGEELRQYVARRAETELIDTVENVFQTEDDGTPPKPELALTGATPATAHDAQGLKEKTMVILSGQLSNHGLAVPAQDHTPRLPNPPASPPTARNRALSPITVQELVDPYLAGATLRSLARDLDMHRTTVDNCLKREGVKQHDDQS